MHAKREKLICTLWVAQLQTRKKRYNYTEDCCSLLRLYIMSVRSLHTSRAGEGAPCEDHTTRATPVFYPKEFFDTHQLG